MPFGFGKKKDKKEEWLKKLGISDKDFRKLSATEAILEGYETHKKIAAITGLDAEKIDKVRRDGSDVPTQDGIFYRMAVDAKNPHNAFFIFFTEMLMPVAAELSKRYHPIIGKRVAKAVESLIQGNPNATFDKILELEDKKIAQVIGKHIEDIRGKSLTDEEWQRLEKTIKAIKKISAKIYSNGLQAPEALYRAADRNDFDRALVEEGILDLEDVEMLKQVFAEISGKKIEPAKPKYPATKKEVEQELRKAGVPEEKIYAELEKRGIPRDVAEKLVEKAHLLSSREVEELIRKHVDNDPVKARAVLEAFERKGKVVPVPRYWADIVSKIATGEIRENELLEALAVSKVFHTAYSKAIAKAAERDEPESVMKRMMFIKNVVNEAHREAVDTLKNHPVYGEHVKRMAPAIEREMKEIAETLSKTYYAKARGDPTLSAREFLQMELNPTVETLAPLRKHLKKVNEDFLAIGKPQEGTIDKAYVGMVKRLLSLALGMQVEKEWVGITHKHEVVRIKLNALL